MSKFVQLSINSIGYERRAPTVMRVTTLFLVSKQEDMNLNPTLKCRIPTKPHPTDIVASKEVTINGTIIK